MYEGSREKHDKREISNNLILMSFGCYMSILLDAEIKQGKKLVVPMLREIKENTIRSPEESGKCRLSCSSP